MRGDGGAVVKILVQFTGSPPRAWGRPRSAIRATRPAWFTPTCVGTAHQRFTRRSANSVHPHVRGDGFTVTCRNQGVDGSPPRAWGRQVAIQLSHNAIRFTPTCVGTAGGRACRDRHDVVHPHVRGDGCTTVTSKQRAWGSPPRAWGRRILRRCREVHHRFTPTCVGTAPRRFCQTSRLRVHPHVRGDGPPNAAQTRRCVGSPPRAWGRRVQLMADASLCRFTPTCVGTASGVRRNLSGCGVHPHVRGDGGDHRAGQGQSGGSPPRAWGRRCGRSPTARSSRFTPTCVGTASGTPTPAQNIRVHPHVRGDGRGWRGDDAADQGSPPRAWGRRLNRHPFALHVGFTPTCVGTATVSTGATSGTGVHPHVRGDGTRKAAPANEPLGSPPRAWGRRRGRGLGGRGVRFTPTCVGTASRR